MKKWFVFAAVISMIGSSGQIIAAGDAAAGKAKSASCGGCHGMDGNSMNPEWPKLAGQHSKYIVKQLEEFKAGKRVNASMSPMAAPLGDADIADLAAYYTSQALATGATDPALKAVGEKIYRGGNASSGVAACIGCHGPKGNGNPAAKFPALGGQHAKYTVNQLKAFRSAERHNDAGKMMRNIAAKMTDKEMDAVASYIEGLH